MRKLLPFVLLVVSVNCSKKEPEPENNKLFGTKWQTQDLASEIVWGGRWFQVIHFKSNTDFEVYSVRNGNIEKYKYEGNYTLSETSVTIRYKDEDKEEVSTYNFKNSGTLECDWGAPYYCTYIKQ